MYNILHYKPTEFKKVLHFQKSKPLKRGEGRKEREEGRRERERQKIASTTLLLDPPLGIPIKELPTTIELVHEVEVFPDRTREQLHLRLAIILIILLISKIIILLLN